MSYIIGIDPARVYTETDLLNGKCPSLGTIGKTANGKEYVMCKVSASNVTNGHVVTIDKDHNCTIAANTSNPPTAANRVGVALGHTTTLTASTSQCIWVQIFGTTLVLASLSALPNVSLGIGSTAGNVDDGVTSASAYISGLYLTTTSSVAGTLANAVLSYPRFNAGG
jgi:hypothetical protein